MEKNVRRQWITVLFFKVASLQLCMLGFRRINGPLVYCGEDGIFVIAALPQLCNSCSQGQVCYQMRWCWQLQLNLTVAHLFDWDAYSSRGPESPLGGNSTTGVSLKIHLLVFGRRGTFTAKTLVTVQGTVLSYLEVLIWIDGSMARRKFSSRLFQKGAPIFSIIFCKRILDMYIWVMYINNSAVKVGGFSARIICTAHA